MGRIYNDIVETVGRTPLVRLNKVTDGVPEMDIRERLRGLSVSGPCRGRGHAAPGGATTLEGELRCAICVSGTRMSCEKRSNCVADIGSCAEGARATERAEILSLPLY